MRDRPGIDGARHAWNEKRIEQRYVVPPNVRLSKNTQHEEKSVNQSKGKREIWDEGFENMILQQTVKGMRRNPQLILGVMRSF